MPYVNIKLVGEITKDQKADISKGVTELISKVTGKDPKYTYVVIEEVKGENWAVNGKLLG